MAAALLGTVAGVARAQTPGRHRSPRTRRSVDRYCAGCHNDRRKSGGFSWTSIDLADPGANAAQRRERHPQGARRADAAGRRAAARRGTARRRRPRRWNARSIAGGARSRMPARRSCIASTAASTATRSATCSASTSTSRRCCRPTSCSRGFDNMADALTVKPALMQGYMRAAEQDQPRRRSATARRRRRWRSTSVPKVVNQMRHVEGAPFGTRGGTAVVHHFPADGDYTFQS